MLDRQVGVLEDYRVVRLAAQFLQHLQRRSLLDMPVGPGVPQVRIFDRMRSAGIAYNLIRYARRLASIKQSFGYAALTCK